MSEVTLVKDVRELTADDLGIGYAARAQEGHGSSAPDAPVLQPDDPRLATIVNLLRRFGGVILSGSQWAGWDKALAVAVLKGQQLRVIGLTPDGLGVQIEWTRIQDRGRLRVAVQGPDGALYIATDSLQGEIFRVVGTPPPPPS